MKINEYNEMMAYLTKPKEKPVIPKSKPKKSTREAYKEYLEIRPFLDAESQMFIEKELGFAMGGSVETPKRGLVDEPGSYSQKPLISDSELKRLAKKFSQSEIAKKTGLSQATIQRYFTRLGIKSVFKPGGYKGAISEARKELEKKLPKIRKLYLTDKLTIPEIADELGYTKKQVESVIEAMRGQGGDYKYRGNIIEPERKKLYEKNKITKKDFEKRGKLQPLKTPQSVVDNVIKDSKNFSFSETATRNNISTTTVNDIRKKYNLKFPYKASTLTKVSDRVTKDANKLLNILNKNPELVTKVEKLYEKAGFNKVQGNSAIQALKAKTILSGNVPRFDLSKSEQKLVDKLAAPRISVETVAREAGIKDADVRSGMSRPRYALQEYFAVGDPRKRGTVFEHSFPRALIPFVKGKKLQQQLMITGERTSPFLNDFKIRFDIMQKNAVEKFLKDGNLTEYNKKINNIRDIVRKTTGGYEIGYIKFDKNKNATPIVKSKPITEGIKQFGVETTQKVSGFKNAKYTTNLLKKYIKNPDNPIFNTLRDEVPVEKITPEILEASEDAAKAYKKAEPFIGNRQKFINFAKNNLNNSLVNALFKSPYGKAAIITGAVLSSSSLAASELSNKSKLTESDTQTTTPVVDEVETQPKLPSFKDTAIGGTAAAVGSKFTKTDPLKKFRRFITAAPVRKSFGKILRGAGTPFGGLALAGTNVLSKMSEGQSLADAVVDPITGLELSLPGLFKENIAKITKNPRLQTALKLGKFGRMLNPVGLGLAALGQGQEFYNQYQALKDLKEQNPRAYEEFISQRVSPALSTAEQIAIEDMGARSGAAGGGIMKMAGKSSGPPPESGPIPQGLDFLFKRGT